MVIAGKNGELQRIAAACALVELHAVEAPVHSLKRHSFQMEGYPVFPIHATKPMNRVLFSAHEISNDVATGIHASNNQAIRDTNRGESSFPVACKNISPCEGTAYPIHDPFDKPSVPQWLDTAKHSVKRLDELTANGDLLVSRLSSDDNSSVSTMPSQNVTLGNDTADLLISCTFFTDSTLSKCPDTILENSTEEGCHRRVWSREEDFYIRRHVAELGCQWRRIAAGLPGRSDDAVRNRWNRLKFCNDDNATRSANSPYHCSRFALRP